MRAISGRVHGPEVRDDRQRLQRRLRDAALHRALEQPPAGLGGLARRAKGPTARDRLEHDPAPSLAVALGEQPQCGLDPLGVVIRGSDELLDRQRRAGDHEQRLDRARELVERIGGD